MAQEGNENESFNTLLKELTGSNEVYARPLNPPPYKPLYKLYLFCSVCAVPHIYILNKMLTGAPLRPSEIRDKEREQTDSLYKRLHAY